MFWNKIKSDKNGNCEMRWMNSEYNNENVVCILLCLSNDILILPS